MKRQLEQHSKQTEEAVRWIDAGNLLTRAGLDKFIVDEETKGLFVLSAVGGFQVNEKIRHGEFDRDDGESIRASEVILESWCMYLVAFPAAMEGFYEDGWKFSDGKI